MRLGGIVLALGAAGCQVVFPLDAKDPLATPQITIETRDQVVLGGIRTDLDLAIVGHSSAVVAYTASASGGSFVDDSGLASLSGFGVATESLQWIPPDELAIKTISVASGYDEVDDGNQDTLDVPLAKRFGNVGNSGARVLAANTDVLAIPIDLPVPCTAVELGAVTGADSVNATQTILGLYSDLSGSPDSLLVATSPVPVAAIGTGLMRVAAPVNLDLAPGRYWVAVAADQQMFVSGDDSGLVGAMLATTGSFPPPATFPAPVAVQGVWALDITVAAR